MERAVEVGKQRNFYYHLSKQMLSSTGSSHGNINNDEMIQPPVDDLTLVEAKSLVDEREKLFSQGKMRRVIATVSLCSFLQGFLQSSINAASLYGDLLGIAKPSTGEHGGVQDRDWQLGIMNGVVYLSAAIFGAPLSLVINYLVGRRGAM